MTLHLIKLCVGSPTIDDLLAWRALQRQRGQAREDGLNFHRTRMMPKRTDEIVGQGSLYWVMSGVIRCRQRIVGLERGKDSEGRSYCEILMHPQIIQVAPHPKRPFQGWRYLEGKQAPADLGEGVEVPDGEMAEELARMGLI